MADSLASLTRAIVEERRTLTADEAQAAAGSMLDGSASDATIAALLTAIAARGETAAELTGFVRGLRERAVPLPLTAGELSGAEESSAAHFPATANRASPTERSSPQAAQARPADRFSAIAVQPPSTPRFSALLDTCGTGGDARGTFNISTAAALVAVAAGARVAKHGNRAITSKCGSADVLEALGVPVDLEPAAAAACLRTTGFVFLHAPRFHPAMARVAPVRRALPFRTLFNLVGPLSNPAGARRQIMGVFAQDRLPIAAEAMRALGVERGLVVHGPDDRMDGLDELTLTGPSHIAEVRGDEPTVTRILHPEEFGLAPAPLTALRGGDTAAENAAVLHAIFTGEPGPRRDVVLLNAAAALTLAFPEMDLSSTLSHAANAIDSGAVLRLLAELREFAPAHSTGGPQLSAAEGRP